MKRFWYVILGCLAILQIAFLVLILATSAGLYTRLPLSSLPETAQEQKTTRTESSKPSPEVVSDKQITAKIDAPAEKEESTAAAWTPWQETLATEARPFQEVCFEDFDTSQSIITQSELLQWFEPVQDFPFQFVDLKRGNTQGVVFEGLAKFKSPWLEDVAHKFSFTGKQAFRWHFFQEDSGVTIEYDREKTPRWSAYTTRRDSGSPTPSQLSLTTTDQGRETIGEIQNGPTVMIFFHDHELIVARGDVVLLRAAQPELPQEVFFQGSTTFRGMAMVPLERQSVQHALHPLDEWPLFSSAADGSSTKDPARLQDHYRKLAWDAMRQGQRRPYSLLRRSVLKASEGMVGHGLFNDNELIRAEIVQLVYHHQWQELSQFCQQIQFFQQRRSLNNSTSSLVDWAGVMVALNLPQATAAVATVMKPSWQPPWKADIESEAFNTMSEIQVARKNQSYQDACQRLTRIDQKMLRQVLPAPKDPELYVSFRFFLEKTIADDKNLQAAIQEHLGTLSRLRVRRAIASGQADEVELAVFCFPETVAAAEGRIWLGDRAMAAGEFYQALDHYQKEKSSRSDLQKTLQARARLAAAMLGEDRGKKVEQAQRLGELSLEANQYESEIARARDSRLQNPINPRMTMSERPVLQHFTFPQKYQVDFFSAANFFNGAKTSTSPSTNDLFYLDSCGQIIAYDGKLKQVRWQSKSPKRAAPDIPCSLRVVYPLKYQKKLFVTGSSGPGKSLFCFDGSTGANLWTAKANTNEAFVSAPIVVEGKILVVTTTKTRAGRTVLRLARFDPKIGRLESTTDLIHLKRSWQPTECVIIPHENKLLVSLAGVIICCDARGRLGWIRRQTLLPSDETHENRRRQQVFYCLEKGKIIIAPPATPTIECIDLDSGQLLWRAVVPDISKLSGKVGGRLIVLTSQGIQARDKTTGRLQWHHELSDLREVFLDENQEKILCWQNSRVAGTAAKYLPILYEISLRTGEEIKRWPLPELESSAPHLGPFILHNQSLWTFKTPNEEDPFQKMIRISPKRNPATAN